MGGWGETSWSNKRKKMKEMANKCLRTNVVEPLEVLDPHFDHVEHPAAKRASEDDVVGPLLGVRRDRKQLRVVALEEELEGRDVLKRPHRVGPRARQLHAVGLGQLRQRGQEAPARHRRRGRPDHAQRLQRLRNLRQPRVKRPLRPPALGLGMAEHFFR
jgi:hypothetical protein